MTGKLCLTTRLRSMRIKLGMPTRREAADRIELLERLLARAKNHIVDWWRPDGSLPPAKSPDLVEDIEAALLSRTAPKEPANPQSCEVAQVGNSTAQPVPEYKERCPHGLRWENAHRCRVCSAPPAQEPAK